MGRTTTVAGVVARRNAGRSRQEIVKPSELIAARPIAGRTLSLAAAKTYNLMLGVAQQAGFADVRYSISKRELRGSHKGNERLAALLNELHSITFLIRGTLDGKPGVWRMPLLSPTFEEDGDEETGEVHYRFPTELLDIIQASGTWSLLISKAMVKFDSVYGLRLYEIGCQYANRDEPFLWLSPSELREQMQVPEDAYRDWTDLRRRVLDAAIAEVNQLAHFKVELPEASIRRHGRKVVKFLLTFSEKAEPDGDKAGDERERHSAGRKARRNGTVEEVVDHDVNEQAIRRLSGTAIEVRQRWYQEARNRGAKECAAATAPSNLRKWIAYVAVDVMKEAG